MHCDPGMELIPKNQKFQFKPFYDFIIRKGHDTIKHNQGRLKKLVKFDSFGDVFKYTKSQKKPCTLRIEIFLRLIDSEETLLFIRKGQSMKFCGC